MQVRQVMNRPGGQQLCERDRSQGRMTSATIEIGGLQIQRPQGIKIFCPQPSKFIQKLIYRLSLTFALLGLAIERIEPAAFAVLQDDPSARHPVGAFSVNEVADNVKRSPAFRTFVAQGPSFGKITKQRIEGRRCAAQKSSGLLQIESHSLNPHESNIRRSRFYLVLRESVTGEYQGFRSRCDAGL